QSEIDAGANTDWNRQPETSLELARVIGNPDDGAHDQTRQLIRLRVRFLMHPQRHEAVPAVFLRPRVLLLQKRSGFSVESDHRLGYTIRRKTVQSGEVPDIHDHH